MPYNRCPDGALTRRNALKLSAAGVMGGGLSGTWAHLARAQEQPPIGTWPAGVSGDTAFIGISVPRTGTYAVPGKMS